MRTLFSFLKDHEQKIALAIGYVLIATLFYGLGKYSVASHPPDIKIEEPKVDLTQIHNNENSPLPQSVNPESAVAGQNVQSNCTGKIKGNISSSGKIYHIPGGAFYNRVAPEMCFDTESAAQAAGFRKSKI